MSQHALLLVGSPKPRNSTSETLGDYLLVQLKQKGLETKKILVNQELKSPGGSDKLISAVNECDILILSCPLYVDSAPATVTKALEIIAEQRRKKIQPRQQFMLALSNSGFPEAHHNETAISIYRCFAKEAGFNWVGGLALGGGGTINGRPLTELGGLVKNVTKSLDLAAGALLEGIPLPEEAVNLTAKPLIPNWLYLLVAQLGWRFQAKEHGAFSKLNARPYKY